MAVTMQQVNALFQIKKTLNMVMGMHVEVPGMKSSKVTNMIMKFRSHVLCILSSRLEILSLFLSNMPPGGSVYLWSNTY